MADHVARMSVQLADEASSNANQVAQSLDLVTTSADKATAATVDVSAATKDFKISAIRLATPPQRWAMSRPRWRIIPARSLITLIYQAHSTVSPNPSKTAWPQCARSSLPAMRP